MRNAHRYITGFLIAASLIGLSACEITDPLKDVELIVDVEDAEVGLGSNGVSVGVDPSRPTAHTARVSSDLDVESVNEIREIGFSANSFRFTPAAGKSSDAAATGTLEIYAAIGATLLPDLPIEVEIVDNEVTSVSPSVISFENEDYTVNEAGLEAFLDGLDEDERPDLDDWANMTMSQVVTAINQALSDSDFEIMLGVTVLSGDLSGTLNLSDITISAQVAQSAGN